VSSKIDPPYVIVGSVFNPSSILLLPKNEDRIANNAANAAGVVDAVCAKSWDAKNAGKNQYFLLVVLYFIIGLAWGPIYIGREAKVLGKKLLLYAHVINAKHGISKKLNLLKQLVGVKSVTMQWQNLQLDMTDIDK
jgi:hypothetical protein